MRAKMMIFSGSTEASSLSLRVQQILTDLAVAFGHSFIMVEDKISELSIQEYGSAMTEEAIEAAMQCDGTLCVAPDEEGMLELADGLDCILRCRVYMMPECLNAHSPLKTGKLPRGVLACPIKLEEQALKNAADHVYSMAKDSGLLISEIPYTGKYLHMWEEAVRPAAARYYLNQRMMTDAPGFISDLIRTPEDMGVLLASASACASVQAAASALCGIESFVYDSYWDEQGPRLFAARLQKNAAGDSINPFGLLYAAADMLKFRFGLSREADFLLTCCNNVLNAGWRTSDIAEDGSMRVSTEAIFSLISEQIDLVAALAAH